METNLGNMRVPDKNGKLWTLREIADTYQIDLNTVKARWMYGDRTFDRLSRDVMSRISHSEDLFILNKQFKSVSEIAEYYNMPYSRLLNRLKTGKNIVSAVAIVEGRFGSLNDNFIKDLKSQGKDYPFELMKRFCKKEHMENSLCELEIWLQYYKYKLKLK